MSRLRKIQKEQAEWAVKNFGKTEPWMPLLGTTEELGELCHAYLKSVQGIRGNPKELEAEMEDAVGDLLIFLLDFCSKMQWDMQEILEKTWNEVKKRDWKKYPKNGVDK